MPYSLVNFIVMPQMIFFLHFRKWGWPHTYAHLPPKDQAISKSMSSPKSLWIWYNQIWPLFNASHIIHWSTLWRSVSVKYWLMEIAGWWMLYKPALSVLILMLYPHLVLYRTGLLTSYLMSSFLTMHNEILSASFWFNLRDTKFCSVCKVLRMNNTGAFIKCVLQHLQ